MTFDGGKYLVIGANGALGSLLAQTLINKGAGVLGTARDQATVARLPARLEQKLLLDLDSDDSIENLTRYFIENDVVLDGVVNAAGLVGFGNIADTSAEDSRKLMQVNHLGPATVISRLLPQLAKSDLQPFVLSITGVVAERIFPGMASYTASKTAHSTWLKALALEARRQKIRVIDARLGHTETGLATRPLFGTAPAFAPGMTQEHVVATIISAIETGITDLPSESFSS